MFAPDTPTTELEAVNFILASIGEQPISTIARAESNADVQAALMTLRRVNRGIQGRGWTFNTDEEYLLIREIDSTILVPVNAVRLRLSTTKTEQSSFKIAERKRKVWDRVNKTFLWSTDLYVDILWLFPFEQLPEAARNYIHVTAGRLFQKGFEGSPLLHQFTAEDEARALSDMGDYEVDTANPNFLNDNITVANTWGER